MSLALQENFATLERLSSMFANWQHGEREQVQNARKQFERALRCSRQNRPAAEVVVYNEIIKNFFTDVDPVVQEIVAAAIFNKAVTLGVLGSPVNEIQTYRLLIDCYSMEQNSRKLRALIVNAYYNSALAALRMGDVAQEINLYRTLIEHYQHSPEPVPRERVAQAMLNLALAFDGQGQLEQEMQWLEALLKRAEQDSLLVVQEIAVKALRYKGDVVAKQGNKIAAVYLYDSLLEQKLDLNNPTIREQVARTMANQIELLFELKDENAAQTRLKDFERNFAQDEAADITEQWGRVLYLQGRYSQDAQVANTAYRALIELFGQDARPNVRQLVARAYFHCSVSATNQEQALQLIEEMYALYGKDSAPAQREIIAKALYNRATWLAKTKPNEALTHYEKLVDRVQYNFNLGPLLACALFNSAMLQMKVQAFEDALQTLNQIISRFEHEGMQAMQWLVRQAYRHIALALLRMHHYDSAQMTLMSVLELYPQMPDQEFMQMQHALGYSHVLQMLATPATNVSLRNFWKEKAAAALRLAQGEGQQTLQALTRLTA